MLKGRAGHVGVRISARAVPSSRLDEISETSRTGGKGDVGNSRGPDMIGRGGIAGVAVVSGGARRLMDIRSLVVANLCRFYPFRVPA